MKKSENGIDIEDDEDDEKIARQAEVERKKKLAEMKLFLDAIIISFKFTC